MKTQAIIKGGIFLAVLIMVVGGVLAVPTVYHPPSQVTNGTFAIGDFTFQRNVTAQGWYIGKYDWTILTGISAKYLVFNGTDLQFNETYLNTTIKTMDTNESSRFDALVATDCAANYVMSGINSTGGVVCVSDQTSAGGAPKLGGAPYIYNDSTHIYLNESRMNTTIITITDARDTDTDTHVGYNATVLANQSGSYGLNRTFLDALYLDDTTIADTNESTRFDALVATNCPAGFKAIGVNTTGGVECLVDTDTDTDTHLGYNTTIFANESGSLGIVSSFWGNKYVATTGDVMTGALNLSSIKLSNQSYNGLWDGLFTVRTLPSSNNNLLFAVEGNGSTGIIMPHFWIQNGAASQASGVSRSFMIVNEVKHIQNTTNITSCPGYMDWANETLKIDCNTTTTGADLLVGDDMQVVGDVWQKDTSGEWHFSTRTMDLLDEVFDDTLMSGVNLNVSQTYATIVEKSNRNLIVNVDQNETIYTSSTAQISFTNGTNATPQLNYIYYDDASTPVLTASTTAPTGEYARVSKILAGDNGTIYASLLDSAHAYEALNKMYDRFYHQGPLYVSGFNPVVDADELNISDGKMTISIDEMTILTNWTMANGYFLVQDDGTYVQGVSLENITQYGDGGTISANKYFNVVWGIVHYNGENTNQGRLMAIVQDEPATEYVSISLAEVDEDAKTVLLPEDTFISKVFTPVVRTVVKKVAGADEFQQLSNTLYYFDERGVIAVSGGGNPPSPSISDHEDLNNLAWSLAGHTIDTNIDASAYQITANQFNATSWANVTITESQISDLNATTVDTDTHLAYNTTPFINESGTLGINLSHWAARFADISVVDTDTHLSYNTTVLENQSGTVGIDKAWFDTLYLDDTTIPDTDTHLAYNTTPFINESGNLGINLSYWTSRFADVSATDTQKEATAPWLYNDTTTIIANMTRFDEEFINESGDAMTVTDGFVYTSTFAGNLIKLDQNADSGASTSTGGALLIENTGNVGAGLIIYSNQNGDAAGRLLNIRADNAAFDQSAFNIDYDGVSHAMTINNKGSGLSNSALTIISENNGTTTVGITGNESRHGTLKITHKKPIGADSVAAALSIDLQGTGTAAQGIFMDATNGGTTGKLLNLKNDGLELLTLDADGKLGLNKSTPTTLLHIYAAADPILTIESGDSQAYLDFVVSGKDDWRIYNNWGDFTILNVDDTVEVMKVDDASVRINFGLPINSSAISVAAGNFTGELNMTTNNITSVDCIFFESGGKICSGS